MLLDSDCEFSESESSGDEYKPTQDELAEVETPIIPMVTRAATHGDTSGLVGLLSSHRTTGEGMVSTDVEEEIAEAPGYAQGDRQRRGKKRRGPAGSGSADPTADPAGPSLSCLPSPAPYIASPLKTEKSYKLI